MSPAMDPRKSEDSALFSCHAGSGVIGFANDAMVATGHSHHTHPLSPQDISSPDRSGVAFFNLIL